MSSESTSTPTDLVRWSFAVNPTRRADMESYLLDLGADVLVRDGQDFVVTWDEPADDLTEIIEAIWSLNGEPFEIIQEDFQRIALHTIQQADAAASEQAA